MEIEKKKFCADLILTDAIMDMADEEGMASLGKRLEAEL